jgi:hypothetical protein
MMAIAALVAWVLTASIGLYMLRTWVVRGGLRRQRATGVGVPPAVVFSHASAALAGLVIWAGFVKTKWDPLAWIGVVLITGAISLGVCTVTLWTPYPVVVPPSGVSAEGGVPLREGADAFTVTDEMIADMLADPFPARRERLKLLPLIPVVHGFGALTTFMLAVFAAISMRLGSFACQWSRSGRYAFTPGPPPDWEIH